MQVTLPMYETGLSFKMGFLFYPRFFKVFLRLLSACVKAAKVLLQHNPKRDIPGYGKNGVQRKDDGNDGDGYGDGDGDDGNDDDDDDGMHFERNK